MAFRPEVLPCAVSFAGGQQRRKISLVSNLLENLANFRGWREAQSSIRIQEGEPPKIPLFIQTVIESPKSKPKLTH
jgi:hypothetical protein